MILTRWSWPWLLKFKMPRAHVATCEEIIAAIFLSHSLFCLISRNGSGLCESFLFFSAMVLIFTNKSFLRCITRFFALLPNLCGHARVCAKITHDCINKLSKCTSPIQLFPKCMYNYKETKYINFGPTEQIQIQLINIQNVYIHTT